MGQYKIDDELVLWQHEYRTKAYKDQFEIPHSANVVIAEVRCDACERDDGYEPGAKEP